MTSKYRSNYLTSSRNSSRSISQNPFLQTYLPNMILIIVIIFSLLVIFSILGIDFNEKISENVSKVVTINAKI